MIWIVAQQGNWARARWSCLFKLRTVQRVAAGWGGCREEDETYVNWYPPTNGTYTLDVPPNIPVYGRGFWSVTVYNSDGYMFGHPANFNSAVHPSNETTTVFFGGCHNKSRQKPNLYYCLPIELGWSLTVRIFRPQKEILDGSWKFPTPKADAMVK